MARDIPLKAAWDAPAKQLILVFSRCYYRCHTTMTRTATTGSKSLVRSPKSACCHGAGREVALQPAVGCLRASAPGRVREGEGFMVEVLGLGVSEVGLSPN